MLPRPLGVVHPVYVYTAKIYNVSYESIRTAVNGPLTAARAGHEPREIRSDTKDRTSVKNPFFQRWNTVQAPLTTAHTIVLPALCEARMSTL